MCFWRKKKKVKESEKQELKEQSKVEDKPKQEVKSQPVKKEEKTVKKESVKQEEKPVSEPQQSQKYHISQNNDDKSKFYKQWRVRKSGSNKTIKFFKTQKEAIDYAKSLAKNADTDIVIHKVDGKIRKQKY